MNRLEQQIDPAIEERESRAYTRDGLLDEAARIIRAFVHDAEAEQLTGVWRQPLHASLLLDAELLLEKIG